MTVFLLYLWAFSHAVPSPGSNLLLCLAVSYQSQLRCHLFQEGIPDYSSFGLLQPHFLPLLEHPPIVIRNGVSFASHCVPGGDGGRAQCVP